MPFHRSRSRRIDSSPRFIRARFASTCPETGKPIRVGDEIAYYPATQKAYHADSKAAADLRSQLFAAANCMADAEW